jgi:hypothetical protein
MAVALCLCLISGQCREFRIIEMLVLRRIKVTSMVGLDVWLMKDRENIRFECSSGIKMN